MLSTGLNGPGITVIDLNSRQREGLKMKCVHLLLFSLVLFLILPTSAHAQAWSGILDPSRAIDWSQAGVPGGIPTNRTKACATIAPEGTKAGPVAPNDINKAIASCPAGGVVLLQAGVVLS